MILNLGCGGSHKGHMKINSNEFINYDLNVNAKFKHVRGEAHKLPFHNKVFEHSICFHLLEHVDNPLVVLRELKRVTQKTVTIKVPNATFFKVYTEFKEHIYSWNIFTLHNLLSKVFTSIDIYGSKSIRKHKMSIYFGLLFFGDNELTAKCRC